MCKCNLIRAPSILLSLSLCRESREPGFRTRFTILSTSEDQDVFDEPTPKTRVLPSRSYTIDNPYSLNRSKVRSLPSLVDDEPEAGSLPSDEVDAPSSPVQSSLGSTLHTSQGKQTSVSSSHNLLDDPVPTSVTSKPNLLEPTSTTQSSRTSNIFNSPLMKANSSSKLITKSSNSVSPVPAPRQDQSQTSLYKPVSAETKQPIAPRISASLPRSYQRSDSARITSVVTPRPFGAPSTKVASLTRSYMVRGLIHFKKPYVTCYFMPHGPIMQYRGYFLYNIICILWGFTICSDLF